MSYSATINVMINAARQSGRLLLRDFNEIEHKRVRNKEHFIQAAERRSASMIVTALQKHAPTYSMQVEGSPFREGSDPNHTWIVDPLDGTTNFSQGIPFFAISLALRKKHDVVAALIYDPVFDYIYSAEKGCGAFMNRTRLRVSENTAPEKSVGCCHYRCASFPKLCAQMGHVRFIGSASLSLAYVASGRFDFYIDEGLRIWDIAAGVLLAKEAGGVVDDFEKKSNVLDNGNLLAASPLFFQKVTTIIA